jgi:hypothetical protein
MKRTKKSARKAQLSVVQRDDHRALLSHFALFPEPFAPMLALIDGGQQRRRSMACRPAWLPIATWGQCRCCRQSHLGA